MNKLQQLAERSDYVKATTALRNAVIEIEELIQKKMSELDETALYVNSHDYVVVKGKYYSYLCDADGHAFGAKTPFFYDGGDYNYPFKRASNERFVEFANDLLEIISILNDIETKKAAEAKPDQFFQFYEDWQNFQETKKQLEDMANKEETL